MLINSEAMTRDHAIPRAHGGDPDWPNIVLACAKCNERRGDTMPTSAELLKINIQKAGF